VRAVFAGPDALAVDRRLRPQGALQAVGIHDPQHRGDLVTLSQRGPQAVRVGAGAAFCRSPRKGLPRGRPYNSPMEARIKHSVRGRREPCGGLPRGSAGAAGAWPSHPAALRQPLPELALGRLLLARLLLTAVQAAVVVLAASASALQLPLGPLAAVVALQAALTLSFWGRQRDGGAVGAGEVFAHLSADAALIGTLVYLSGGYANPFISLLLVPLVLCATLLPAALAWAMAGLVAGLYTLLMSHYLPLRLDMTEGQAVNLHLSGMWLNFLLTVALVAFFLTRLTSALRARDRALGEAREVELRDEHLFALGMQAAASAHDLSTPLSTLSLTLDDLRREYAGDEELAPSLDTMGAQVERMQAVLGRLRASAEMGSGATASPQPADAWVRELVEHWRLMRPRARIGIRPGAAGRMPLIRDEPLLASCLTTLLNNAADASREAIEVELAGDGGTLEIRVLDRGPGLAGETEGFSPKPDGWGIGLQLAHATLARLGGALALEPRPGGGTRAVMRLPLDGVSVRSRP
jgi:two-component system, sensor histidine kinase RegB